MHFPSTLSNPCLWYCKPCQSRTPATDKSDFSCLLHNLIRSKETSKLCVTGLCVGNSPGTGEFPEQMASNAENVSIWWRHHGGSEATMKNMGKKVSTSIHKSKFMYQQNIFLADIQSLRHSHMMYYDGHCSYNPRYNFHSFWAICPYGSLTHDNHKDPRHRQKQFLRLTAQLLHLCHNTQ